MGSMLAARRAGMNPAMAAKAERTRTAAHDRQRIVDSNAVELARHEAAAEQRDRDADGEAESYLPGGGAENEREDVVAVGAESHAQADFAGAARDRVGSDAVEADGGQHESEQSKQSSEAADEAFLIEVSGDLVVESLEVEDREIGIDIRERAANERLEAGGVSGIAKSDRSWGRGNGFPR